MEIFRIRTEEEIYKKQLRKKKRAKEKIKEDGDQVVDATTIEEGTITTSDITDRFTPYLIIRGSGKIRSFDFASTEVGRKGSVHVSRY